MSDIKIGTHNGQFHCDEALACFMLKQLPEYREATIVRTRDPALLEPCDIVVDVGAVFDKEKRRFDHHQRSFNETFSSLDPSKPYNIKLSSAGLIYVFYGKQFIEATLHRLNVEDKDKENADTTVDQALVDIIHDKLYENFIIEIDGIDNGVEIADKKAYNINTNLSARVSYLNPSWNQPNLDENAQFEKAMKLVGDEITDRIRFYAQVWWPVRSLVKKSIETRHEIDPSGAIVRMDSKGPWKSHLFDLEKELNLPKNEIKFAIYEDASKSWRIQCVPIEENSFTNRLSLPAAWCGIRDEALSQLTGIPDCIFVHANGFIGGNKTYEGALRMLQWTLSNQ